MHADRVARDDGAFYDQSRGIHAEERACRNERGQRGAFIWGVHQDGGGRKCDATIKSRESVGALLEESVDHGLVDVGVV